MFVLKLLFLRFDLINLIFLTKDFHFFCSYLFPSNLYKFVNVSSSSFSRPLSTTDPLIVATDAKRRFTARSGSGKCQNVPGVQKGQAVKCCLVGYNRAYLHRGGRKEDRKVMQSSGVSIRQTRRRAAQVIKDGCDTVIMKPPLITLTELHKPHLAHSRVASTRHLMCSLPTLHYSSTWRWVYEL